MIEFTLHGNVFVGEETQRIVFYKEFPDEFQVLAKGDTLLLGKNGLEDGLWAEIVEIQQDLTDFSYGIHADLRKGGSGEDDLAWIIGEDINLLLENDWGISCLSSIDDERAHEIAGREYEEEDEDDEDSDDDEDESEEEESEEEDEGPDPVDEPKAAVRRIHWVHRKDSLSDNWNLIDDTGRIIAWVERRPENCDRGHWKGCVDVGDLNIQDGWPNYYMDLGRAMQEIVAFLHWRLDKIPALETEFDSEREATMLSLDPTTGAVNRINGEGAFAE